MITTIAPTDTLLNDVHLDAAPVPPCPFVGLNPFSTDEAILFFGRRKQTVELLDLLRQTHFIAVVGSSGSGKSSLVRAGLIPQLKAGFLVETRDRWRIAVIKPGDAPIKNLAKALMTNAAAMSEREMTENIRNSGALAIIDGLRPMLDAGEENLLLVVDQFEELFRFGIESGQPDKREEAEEFVTILLELAMQAEMPCFVVMTMRSDFIGDCDNFYGLPEALNRSQFLVPRLTREQRRQAIEGPIRLFQADITPRLLDRVVNDVGDHSDQLPVMQHALMRTWENWKESGAAILDLPHYESIGGIKGALSRDADAALQSLSEAERSIAKRIFQALTDTDARNRRIRRPAHLSELALITSTTPEQVLAILENFKTGGRSFLTQSLDPDPVIDISHESLIRQWATMSEWVAEETESRAMLSRLADAARLYQQHPSDDLLWRGSQLDMALEWEVSAQPTRTWANRYRCDLLKVLSFMARSRQAREKEIQEKEAQARNKLRRRQILFTAYSLAVLGALALALYAWRQQAKAKEQEQYALRLNYIATMNLAADEIGQNNIIGANELLNNYLPGVATSGEDKFRSFYWYYLLRACLTKTETLQGHQDIVNSVASSADGNRVASGGDDQVIRIWDLTNKKLIQTMTGRTDSVKSVAWSPNGKLLASGGRDKTVKIWDVESGKEWQTLNGHESTVNTVAWSPDGKTLASGGGGLIIADQTIRIWNVTNGRVLRTIRGHTDSINSVAWHPDGKTLASAGEDKVIRIWDVATGREIRRLRGHGNTVCTVSWSSDGKMLASGSVDRTIRIWEVAAGKEIRTLSGHKNTVYSVTWDAENKILASSSADKSIKLWEVSSGKELRTLNGHINAVSSIAWSADGASLVSGSWDKTIRLWDLAEGKEWRTLTGHQATVNSLAWSLDGKLLASGSGDILHNDNSVKLWDVTRGAELRTLVGHTDAVYSVAWRADSKLLASGSLDQTIKVWDVESGKAVGTLTGHTGSVISVSWSPARMFLASGSRDKTIKIWDAINKQERQTLSGHTDSVNAVAWGADGRMLASGSDDKTIRLWQVDRSEVWKILSGHKKAVVTIAWSPDGKFLASGSHDKTIKIWDATSGDEVRTLQGHGNTVYSVAWSADGKTLASGSVDKTTKLWEVASGKEMRTLQRETSSVFAVAFSPLGQVLASSNYDSEKEHGLIHLWFAATEGEVEQHRRQ